MIMKTLFFKILSAIICLAIFSSCEEEDKRKVFPNSTPVIEEAKAVSVNSSNQAIVFAGDSINISAKVSDTKTPLSTLSIKIVMGNRLIKNEKFRTKGREAEVNERFKIPFISELKDGMIPEIFFILENVEGDISQYKLTSQQSLEIMQLISLNIFSQ